MAENLKVRELEAERIVVGKDSPAPLVIEAGREGAHLALLDRTGVPRIEITRTGGFPAFYGIVLFNGDGTGLVDIAAGEEGAFISVREGVLQPRAIPGETFLELRAPVQQAAPPEYRPGEPDDPEPAAGPTTTAVQ